MSFVISIERYWRCLASQNVFLNIPEFFGESNIFWAALSLKNRLYGRQKSIPFFAREFHENNRKPLRGVFAKEPLEVFSCYIELRPVTCVRVVHGLFLRPRRLCLAMVSLSFQNSLLYLLVILKDMEISVSSCTVFTNYRQRAVGSCMFSSLLSIISRHSSQLTLSIHGFCWEWKDGSQQLRRVYAPCWEPRRRAHHIHV